MVSLGSPLWLSEGQEAAIGNRTIYINVIQFDKVISATSGYSLQFDTPLIITSPNSSPAAVPTGKVWKIESVGLDVSAQAFGGDNLGNHVATTTLNMNNNVIENLSAPTKAKDAVNVSTIQNSSLIYGNDIGVADVYAVALSQAITTYTTGMIVNFKATNNNTGSVSATLNVNGLGAKSIKKQGGNSDLAADDITAGQIVSVVYDGTYFQIIGQLGNVVGGAPHGKQMFTSSGTFTVPAGVTTVYLSMCGGGGSGSAVTGGAGGGGGGASALSFTYSVNPLDVITVTVGTGGAGKSFSSATGNPGTASSFGTFTCGGGAGAYSSSNGGAGGTGSIGSIPGTAGGRGNDNGNNGDGGSSMFGAGGSNNGYSIGNPGGLYGGGSSGGGNGSASSAGAPGFVLVEW